MKKIFFAALLLGCCILANAQVSFEALTFTPKFPKPGQTISFKYDASLSPLIDEKKVDVVIYSFSTSNYKVLEPKIIKTGKVYTGSFKVDSTANCIAFGFSSDKEKDANAGKGYIIPIYSTGNAPLKDYYSSMNNLQSGFGEYLFGMSNDAAKGLTVLEEGIKQFPDLKSDPMFFGSYLRAVNSVKKKDAPPVILSELQQFESRGKLTEAGYNTLIQWYSRDKRKEKADSLTAAMKAAFPDGNWKKSELSMNFNKEKDAAKKLEMYNDYIAKYPRTEDNKLLIDNFKTQLANAYAKAKDYTAFNQWNKELSKATQASNNNNIAWAMAEAGENIEEAKKMAAFATGWAKNEMLKPTEKKPDYSTAKQWAEQRRYQYAMYADTYAFILFQTGDFKTGLPYAKDAAAASKFKNAEYNERYSMLLEKVMPAATVKTEIEQFVKDGVASSKTKELLKKIYTAEKKSEAGYDEYLAKLEMAAKLKKKEELAKTQTNDPAPKFSLKDMEGNLVSLDGLKGKVVIVDFWATWCGPCIASMPAMKTAQEKLKARGDVEFVFVDTWETVDNKTQNASDFMKKNNYPFHVLMDDENKVVGDFKVSGIPTKFIIDKTGNIRFKAVGWGGNDDALIDEVNTMVELAAAEFPVKGYVK